MAVNNGGIANSDLVIKYCLEQGINDLIAQPWLINQLMSSITQFEPIAQSYKNDIENCREFILNNKIGIYHKYTKDDLVLPCITIALGSSSEAIDFRTMGDATTVNMIYAPTEIGKPLPYLVKPFVPVSYDSSTGKFVVPSGTDLTVVGKGQTLLNPNTGEGFVIVDVSQDSISIEAGHILNWTKVGVFPQFPFYKANLEHNFYNQNFSIGVHTQEPATLLFLEAAVTYILLRYKEALLEARNFSQSTFSISDFAPNGQFAGPENAYSRYFSLSGVAINSWVKQPARLVEAAIFKDINTGFAGIKILSNLDSPTYLKTNMEPWTVVKDE